MSSSPYADSATHSSLKDVFASYADDGDELDRKIFLAILQAKDAEAKREATLNALTQHHLLLQRLRLEAASMAKHYMQIEHHRQKLSSSAQSRRRTPDREDLDAVHAESSTRNGTGRPQEHPLRSRSRSPPTPRLTAVRPPDQTRKRCREDDEDSLEDRQYRQERARSQYPHLSRASPDTARPSVRREDHRHRVGTLPLSPSLSRDSASSSSSSTRSRQ